MWLSLGGVHTIAENAPEKTSNTHLVISSSGDIVATYNKTHLFDVNVPGAVSLCESAYVRPGTSLAAPVSTPLGSLGLGVCYDLRFAEQCQELAAAGAEILPLRLLREHGHGALGAAAAGPGHGDPVLRGGRGADRPTQRQEKQLRPQHDRGPVGRGHGAVRGGGGRGHRYRPLLPGPGALQHAGAVPSQT